MRVIESRYLNDGKLFNQGQGAALIVVEDPADFDQMLLNIDETHFYDGGYLQENLGYAQAPFKVENIPLAAVMEIVGADGCLEMGCGKGDVLFLLNQRGYPRVRGLDVSPQIVGQVWPPIGDRVDCGDFLGLAPSYRAQNMRFRTFCGFDIWEHLHPAKLDEYVQTMLELAEDDALFFFVVPGYGVDRVWGELFPLEFEENRAALDARQPFTHLLAANVERPIPVNGHLTWAHSEWWEKLFTSHGLVRCVEWEADIHNYFNGFLHRAQQSFYLFRRDTRAAKNRERQSTRRGLTQFRVWHLLYLHLRSVRRYEMETGQRVADPDRLEVFADINLEKLMLDMDDSIGQLSKCRPWQARYLVKRFLPLHWKARLRRWLPL